jgi:hypothetical protein
MTANTVTNHADTGKTIHARVGKIHMQMLDVIERMLGELAAPPASGAPRAVARRQVANTLGLWRFCARSTCHRSRCCRGEPRHCLHYALPLLPAEMLESLLTTRKERRRRFHGLPGQVYSRAGRGPDPVARP